MLLLSFEFTTPASSYSEIMNNIFVNFLIVGGVILLGVCYFTLVLSNRFKVSRHKVSVSKQSVGKNVEKITIIAASLIILIFLVITINGISRIQEPIPAGKKSDIIVTGHQWWWEVEYPNDSITTANELHIPVGKKILLELHSADVIHDLNIPALTRKMDMIPGVQNYLWIESNKRGIFEGCCNEFCGAQHAWMRIQVFVHEQASYNRWIREQKKIVNTDSLTPIQKEGAKLFQEKVCSNCHAIRGTNAIAKIGPDLSHLASRKMILSGKLYNNLLNLSRWIEDPQKIKSKAHMPNFILTKEEVNALASYLNALK